MALALCRNTHLAHDIDDDDAEVKIVALWQGAMRSQFDGVPGARVRRMSRHLHVRAMAPAWLEFCTGDDQAVEDASAVEP